DDGGVLRRRRERRARDPAASRREKVLSREGVPVRESIMRGRLQAGAVLLLLFAASVRLHAQTTEAKLAWLDALPPAGRQAKLVEPARTERATTASGSVRLAATQTLLDGFIKQYPLIKAHSVRVAGAGIITRVDSEARAGKPFADIIDSGQLGMLALMDKKIYARSRSPE